MTLLERGTSYWASGSFMFIVGIGSGMFNSPNTAAMMGTVKPYRRGIAAGARVLVQNTGAVISIAFVLAIVTSAVPKTVLFQVFSGLANHISNSELQPFISNMHTALWVLAIVSLLGAFVAAARPRVAEPGVRHADVPDQGPEIKPAGVREARVHEAGVQEARVKEAGVQEAGVS